MVRAPTARIGRLAAFLDQQGLGAVWFARPNAFAWLTGGDNVVDRSDDVGVAAAGYDGSVRVLADGIEARRLRDEEVPQGIPVESFPWHEQSLADAVAERSPTPTAADFDVPGLKMVDGSTLRQPLTPEDVARYRDLGRAVAATVEGVCREIVSDDTERAVAAELRKRLFALGVETPVVLVGGSGRASSYRHFTPRGEPLGDYALLSVTAECGGLHAS